MAYIKRLDSGWKHIRISKEIWAQVPPDFLEEEIPGAYVFQPTPGKIERLNKLWQCAHGVAQDMPGEW